MCGIAGVAGASRDDGARLVEGMSAAIVHRGPDDEGVWAADGLALGIRRLSIIDLAGGHQPMWTDDGIGIVFNGEVYNYRELRSGLEREGVRFATHSDTEVLLRLYAARGIDALAQLEGMFAFCIYDARAGVLHLARDRLGKKPLYYAEEDGRFVFASELKALLAGLQRRPALDRQALHHYLTLRYVPGPETVWQGVRKLAPGHRLAYDLRAGTLTERAYWSVDFLAEEPDSARDYASEFAELYLAAVEKRLEAADVPVGVLLSGGLDSSATSAAAIELGHRAFHTFSVGFEDGGEFSELPFARETAAHIGSTHHEVVIGRREFVDYLPELVWYTDEPLADLAAIPLHFVSRLAREHVKVVLSGEGSDEVLAGYDLERLARDLARLRLFDQLPRPVVAAGAAVTGSERLATVAETGLAGYAGARRLHMTHVFSEDEKQRLWRDSESFTSTDELIASWYDATRSPHPIDQIQQVYCGSWLVEDLLMKGDKMTMAASLELRTPFLDHALVEWAARLPLRWKTGDRNVGWESKRILREFARQRLPQRILERPKQGFPVPAYRWLAGELGEWAERRLLRSEGTLTDLFDASALAPTVASARAGDGEAAHRIWAMLVLDHWLERWL